MEEAKSTSGRRLYAVKEWPKVHGNPSEGGLRHLIFNAETNGFKKVIRRIGRRILLDEPSYFEWLDESNGRGKAR